MYLMFRKISNLKIVLLNKKDIYIYNPIDNKLKKIVYMYYNRVIGYSNNNIILFCLMFSPIYKIIYNIIISFNIVYEIVNTYVIYI